MLGALGVWQTLAAEPWQEARTRLGSLSLDSVSRGGAVSKEELTVALTPSGQFSSTEGGRCDGSRALGASRCASSSPAQSAMPPFCGISKCRRLSQQGWVMTDLSLGVVRVQGADHHQWVSGQCQHPMPSPSA